MADRILTPCNVACGSGIVAVNSPNDSTLQCDTWLWNDLPLNSPTQPPYWNSIVLWFPFPHITAVDMSFSTSLRNFIQIGPPSAEKMTSCRFSRWRISAILDCRDPIMGSLKSPCTTSYSCVLESLLSQSCWLWYVTIQTHVFWKPVFEVFCQTPKTGIISIWLLCTDMY